MKLFDVIQRGDPGPGEVPILANVDPQDIPPEVGMNMVPTLEEPEAEKKLPEFPETYAQDRLDLSGIKGLKHTCESLDYLSQAAANQAELIHDSIEQAQAGDISDVSTRIVRTQIASALSIAPEDTRAIEEGLEKILTSNGPYTKAATLEALSVTLDTLKPLILKGLQVSKGLADYIQKNGNLGAVNKQLTLSFELMKTLDASKEPGQMQERLADVYPKIIEAVKAGFSPEEVPNQIQLAQGSVPMTACVCIARGLGKIRLETERNFSSSDLKPVMQFLQLTIQVLQLLSGNLQHTLELLGQSPEAAEKGGEKKETEPTNQDVKVDGELSRQMLAFFTAFFQTVRGLSIQPGGTYGDSAQGQQGEKSFPIMPGWEGVDLLPNDDSQEPVNAGRSQMAVIGYKEVPDLITITQRDLLPKLSEIFKLTKANEAIVSQILEKLGATFNGRTDDVQAGRLYQTAVMKLLQAVKLSTKLVLASSHATLSITEACVDVSRGIGIIVDTH